MSDDSSILWEHDEETVEDLGVEVPPWIEDDITPADVAAIVQGGCASGAYMPAVTYHSAASTMAEHGDAVLDYIQGHDMDPPAIGDNSWSGHACDVLSMAVELWAGSVEAKLVELLEEAQEDRERAAEEAATA